MDARIVVKMTATMGRGVFAARPINTGDILDDIFYTIEVPPHERESLTGATPSRFWFENDAEGTALLALGYISLLNHSLSPNIDPCWHLRPEGQVVQLRAIKDIAAGEQLFIDYRFDGDMSDPVWANGGVAQPHAAEEMAAGC